MKKLRHLLAVLVAIFVSIPIANATVKYVISSPELVWKYEGTTPGADAYSAAALTDGRLYTIGINAGFDGTTYKTLYYLHDSNGDGTAEVYTVSAGATAYFPGAVASDDNGTLTMWNGTRASSIGKIALKQYDSNGAQTNLGSFDLSSVGLSTYLYYHEASGDIANGTGYVWFTANNGTVIDKIKVTNKTYGGTTSYSLLDVLGEGNTLGAQSYIKVYKSDASTDTHSLFVHDILGEFYDCTISGSEITSTKISGFPVARKSNNVAGSDMFELQGKKILVYNTGNSNGSANSRANQFVVWNMTDGTYTTIQPFSTTVSTTGSPDGLIGCWIDIRHVSDSEVEIFAFSPGVGAAKYKVTATEKSVVTTALTSLTHEYIENTVTNIGRQDIKLTWEAPTGYSETEITGYKIYRNGSLLTTVGATTLTYTNTNIISNYTYTVVPLYDGEEEDASLGKSVTTTEVHFIPIAVKLERIKTYNGYANVQLFWERPNIGKKPSYFNIYRDGNLIGTSQSYNFYEEMLTEGTHEYYVESVYEGETESAISNTLAVDVISRATEKTTYTLTAIYNYPIDEITGTVPDNFNYRNYYRQGAYYNGKWYIAQRSDQLCLKDQDKENGITSSTRSDYKSTTDALGSNDARGGVIVFSAVDPRTGVIDAKENNRLITITEGTNVGIATDSKGNIFIRQNDDTSKTRLTATTPTDAGTNVVPTGTWFEDNFSRRLTGGYIYLASDDYTTAIDVDLTGLDLANNLPDWNTLSTSDGYVDLAYKSQRGRSDYYRIDGDLTSNEGAYLYFSPSKSGHVVRVNIKVSGNTATVGTPEFANLTGTHTDSEGNSATVTYGIENYAFPVDGRHSYIGQIRSNGYFGIHPAEGDNPIEMHPIFTTESRINNSGGTTIEFNNDLFIIAPQNMFSSTSGDFIVAKGIKTDVADVSTADLSIAMPVATYNQTEMSTNETTNASGCWMFAEYGMLDGTTATSKETAECVFIYQYVPGERFAKYMLVPNSTFPAPPVAINLDPVYTVDGNEVTDNNSSTGANEDAVDLLRFDGVASWTKPDYDNDLADKYKYNSYNVKVYTEAGQTLLEQIVNVNDANYGTEETGYSLPISNAYKKFKYFINVSANYVNISDATDIHTSEISYAYTGDLYTGIEAKGTVKVYTNPAFPVWYDENGNLVYKYSHRVDIDFNKPDFDGDRVEPVTHYEIWIDKGKDGTYEEQLMNFYLMTGKYNPATRADVGTSASQIAVTDGKIVSATYDPDTSKGYALGESEDAANYTDDYLCVLTFFQLGGFNENANGEMGTGDASELNPVNWNYQLRSVYAASNARISTTETYNMETGGTPIFTGINNVINDGGSLKLYPIPTDFILNIDNDDPIYSVQIYDEAGRLVENFIGNNSTSMQVNIENLATGYYFVKVNSNEPVKILKK